MESEQKGLLEDLILEMMETNQNLVSVDSSMKMNSDYLNNINANSWASFEQLHTIASILSGNQLAALEKAKEDGAMQERMLKALDGISENTKEKKKAKDLDTSIGMGGILGGLAAFVGGFIKGYLVRFADVAKGFYNLAKATFGLLGKWLTKSFSWLGETNIGKAVKGKIASFVAGISMQFDLMMDTVKGYFKAASGEGSVLGRIKTFFTGIGEAFFKTLDGWKDEFKIWKEFVGPMATKVKALLAPILDIGARMDDVKGAFTFIKDTVKGWITGVFDKIKNVLGILSGGDSILAKVGSFFGKFLAPVTFLMTLWDTVQGAWQGYQEGGLFGAVKGALTGFLGSLVGEPLNMLKSAVSWIAEKLGFTEVSKVLDSFDFMLLIKSSIAGIYDWIKLIFTDPGAALDTLWNNLVGEGGWMDMLFKPIDMLIDWVTKKLGWRDENAPEFSIGDILRNVWNTVIDWVASLVEQVPVVGGRGAEAIRSMKAGKATANIKEMATKKIESKPEDTAKEVTPEKTANTSGDTLKTNASEKANTTAVAEAARDTAIMSGVGSSGGGNSNTSISANNSQSTINISSGMMPDRTDLSLMSGGFGISP